MPQTLYPKAFPEGVTFTKTYAASGGMHIGELPGGGFSRLNGEPVQSKDEFVAVMSGAPLQRALDWFAHRDDEAPEAGPPEVTWRQGKLVYVETGVPLASHAEIIQAFPEESPMQHAALEWFGQAQVAKQAAKFEESNRHDQLIASRPPAGSKQTMSGLPRKDVTKV